MKYALSNFKIVFSLSICLLFAAVATAQKLPGIQETSSSAPANLKIDGNAVEWGDQFKAYNSSVELFYTIANDKDRLYLVVQTSKPIIAKKIISYGLTFTINMAGKKDSKGAVAITYPILGRNSGVISNSLSKKGLFNLDSVDGVMNKQLSDNSKKIKIKGSDLVTDSLIAVYNDINVRAASLFKEDRIYAYELAIPLKILKLSASSGKFAYQIILNGRASTGVKTQITTDGRGVVFGDRSKGETQVALTLPPEEIASFFQTDFWGEYTLAK